MTVTQDMQKLIQLNGDGKADFHLPIVFEKVAEIFAQHLSKMPETSSLDDHCFWHS